MNPELSDLASLDALSIIRLQHAGIMWWPPYLPGIHTVAGVLTSWSSLLHGKHCPLSALPASKMQLGFRQVAAICSHSQAPDLYRDGRRKTLEWV